MTPFDFSQCPGYCERARQIMLCQTHPLILKKADEPKPCLLAADQALATYLEMEEEGKARLAEIQNAIAILRDRGSCPLEPTRNEPCEVFRPAKERGRTATRGRGGT